MWDRYWKIATDYYGRKRKLTGYIYLDVLKYPEAKVHFKLRSCLKDSVINYSSKIRKYINKHEIYRKCLPRRVKDKKVNEIENTSYVRSIMNMNPLFDIKRELCSAASILRRVNCRVYIFTCSVRSDEYMCNLKNEFFMKVNSNRHINQNFVGIPLIM